MILNPRSLGRRSFLQACGGSALLAYWARSSVGRAAGVGAPQRLVLVHRPSGSIAEDWLRAGQRGPILEPFAAVWPYAVALKGVNVRPSNGLTGGSHEAGLLTTMTGGKLGAVSRTNDDYRSTIESLDQKLIKQSAVLNAAPIKSLQLAAHAEEDGGLNETPNSTMSYSGPDTPLYPNTNADQVFTRLFGDLMPGGMTDANLIELQKRRARRQSVLDAVSADLTMVRGRFPTSFKDDLDIHAAAIRELELSLDRETPMSGAVCTKPTIEAGVKPGSDNNTVGKLAAIQFKLMTAALTCDLTRSITFMWSTGASKIAFPQLGTDNHHSTSHANVRPVLSNVDRWFSEQTAPFIQQLINTPDAGGGKLIDNTLVWYLSEVAEGYNHSFNDYPYVLFGGDGVGLKQRGRVADVSAQNKTTNDLWSAIAPIYGGTLGGYQTEASGPITGIFTP